ncbi:putative N-acetyltransferase YhdJ [Sporosarcina luteola]|uniref:Putative N-acetyltransferase YhdJ n=1 Tax=Sporosarcina luteola TaxID=582850 RepID=A0A511Z538_9BACL|nr:GNAT family N-acetyltransferase [Sporosarcina luteola]GEN82563.1 putative N-acetyltransferase YhdJ [Sporosarcina luteola]
MDTMIVKELESPKEMLEAFPVMNQLRTHLDEKTYLDLVIEAKEKDMYRLFALFDQGEIVAVIGFKPMITLYYGRFVWVCDLVTDQTKRSNGYGERLLSYVHEWAEDHEYRSVALSSGLQRTDAHRFYEEKMGYDKVSYVFKKNIISSK